MSNHFIVIARLRAHQAHTVELVEELVLRMLVKVRPSSTLTHKMSAGERGTNLYAAFDAVVDHLAKVLRHLLAAGYRHPAPRWSG